MIIFAKNIFKGFSLYVFVYNAYTTLTLPYVCLSFEARNICFGKTDEKEIISWKKKHIKEKLIYENFMRDIKMRK